MIEPSARPWRVSSRSVGDVVRDVGVVERRVGDAAVLGRQGEEAALEVTLRATCRIWENTPRSTRFTAELARYSDAGGRPAVEGGEVLVLVDADAPHALGGGGAHATGAGLAAGAEDDVGALADELLGVGRALVRGR